MSWLLQVSQLMFGNQWLWYDITKHQQRSQGPPLSTKLTRDSLQDVKAGKRFTTFQVYPHAERMSGNLKRCESFAKVLIPQSISKIS